MKQLTVKKINIKILNNLLKLKFELFNIEKNKLISLFYYTNKIDKIQNKFCFINSILKQNLFKNNYKIIFNNHLFFYIINFKKLTKKKLNTFLNTFEDLNNKFIGFFFLINNKYYFIIKELLYKFIEIDIHQFLFQNINNLKYFILFLIKFCIIKNVFKKI